MNEKKWLKIFSIFLIINFMFLLIFNYVVDPFNIFHTKLLKYEMQTNERFTKIEFLEKNNQNFNAYLFGSSRIGTTPPSTVEAYVPNSKFYNFTLSNANLYDYLTHLEFFIKRKYPIKTLYLQLDIEDLHYYGQDSSDYHKKLHPLISDSSSLLYYMEYLTGFFPVNSMAKIELNLNGNQEVKHSLETGIWSVPNKEKELLADCKAYILSRQEFQSHYKETLTYTEGKKNISALKKIVTLCKENKIKLYVFTTPHNHNMMSIFYKESYLNYVKDLAQVTDFYDFSGYNSVTNNDCNYYDISHYRPLVAKLIAGRIFYDKNMVIPDDFGKWVTKEDVENHLKNLSIQIDDYRKNM